MIDGVNVKRGQTMVEYVIVLTALLGAIAALTCLVAGARKSVERTETLVSSDYP